MRLDLDDRTLLLMEAAQVLWEDVFERSAKYEALRADIGTVDLRWRCRLLAPFLDHAWNELTYREMDELAPYDWEFTPFFVDACVDECHTIHHDWQERFRKAVDERLKKENPQCHWKNDHEA